MAHTYAKPKTQIMDLNEFKSAESQTQIILHRDRNREKNDDISQVINPPNRSLRMPLPAQGDSRAPGP